MIGIYARVSTPEQDLSRQVKRTVEFAESRLDASTGETDASAISLHAEQNALSLPADFGNLRIYVDKSTGTDTDRGGFRDMMSDVQSGGIDAVVVNSVSRLARSIRDLESISDRIVEENAVGLHIISEGFDLDPGNRDPYQRAMFQLLGVFAELEAEMTRQRIQEGIQTRMENDDYHHGPSPLGFDKNDGRLREAANYDRVRSVLELVLDAEMSKRQAAKELDTSRRTINRSLDRLELYQLDHKADQKDSAGGRSGSVPNAARKPENAREKP